MVLQFADCSRHKTGLQVRRSFGRSFITVISQLLFLRYCTYGFKVPKEPRFPALDIIPLFYRMMPSRSTPNLQTNRENKNNSSSIYSYLQNQSGLNFAPLTIRDAESPPPAPPVRDSSSLKSIKYGPGHEKFPSWPVPAAADVPQVLRGPPSGGSHRSKSWTDHTNYPKEKVVTYTRPYMKRQHSSMQQKLKTVMEKCEKISPETYESRIDNINDHLYLPRVDREGKAFGDMEYMVPSPPERDNNKPQLTQADLEEYARSYDETAVDKFCKYNMDIKGNLSHLTQVELEQYSRNYDESLSHQHQKQSSYAQSEGYHSYVSSTDSTSTPFLDRLRRDSEVAANRSQVSSSWDELSEQDNHVNRREGRDSVVTTSSGSASSSETLKWHGSLSDVSVASSSCTQSVNSSMSKQLIAHSARVQTPQKLHTENVRQPNNGQYCWKEKEMKKNKTNQLKLFPVNTYTVEPTETLQEQNVRHASLQQLPSVADRINELEKQQKYSYLDPEKKHRIPDPTLKAIQKKALLSFYERHHSSPNKNSAWRSEPQLARSQPALIHAPQPPPRVKIQSPSRRASSASDYASGTNSRRSSLSSRDARNLEIKLGARHQHSNSCGSLSTDLLGPIIVGPSISVDDWIPDKPPERPPKNPNLRAAFPDLFKTQRLPSPDLPPPSPPTVLDDEVFYNDEPLPPPPPELQNLDWKEEFSNRSTDTKSSRQFAEPQVKVNNKLKEGICDTNSNQNSVIELQNQKPISCNTARDFQTNNRNIQTQKPVSSTSNSKTVPSQQTSGFFNTRMYSERLSMRYPSVQKLPLHGAVAVSQKVAKDFSQPHRSEPLRPRFDNKIEDFKKFSSQLSADNKSHQRASIAESPSRDVPPPLQPRQMRINQSMRARLPDKLPSNCNRQSPPRSEKLKEFSSKPLTHTMSHSKASYLASRRERERIVPDSDMGIYKRTSSPNGHISNDPTSDFTKVNSRDAKWSTKNTLLHNNTNLIRRLSMTEKSTIHGNHLSMRCDGKEEFRKIVLPDVLPVKEKFIPHRPQFSIREVDSENILQKKPRSPPKYTSPPSSPTKAPSKNLSLTPVRSPLSISPPSTTCVTPLCNNMTTTSPINSSTPNSTHTKSPISSPSRNSPQVPPILDSNPHPTTPCSSPSSISSSLSKSPPNLISESSTISSSRSSPNSDCYKLKSSCNSPLSLPQSPKRNSPMISTSTNTPSQNSPIHTPPPSSPKMYLTTFPSCEESDTQPPVVEGLQMIQRTEVILRVNVSTTDAASQTEKDELLPTPLPTRRKLQEEIDCEKLSLDIINQLPDSDKLKELLLPGPDFKKPTDYVSGLFRPEVTSRPRPTNSPFRSHTSTPNCSPTPSLINCSPSISTSLTTSSLSPLQQVSILPSTEPTSPLSPTSTYFTTSESKAKFLTKYSQDMNQFSIVKDTKDLDQKKVELVNRLDRKLEVLRDEQLVVSEECRINDELGENVEFHMNKLARPHETAKFRLHVEEVGKITSLLLGLSGRLARAENALMTMGEDDAERQILESKKDKLKQQLEEAKVLKESIDRRSISVSSILCKYLNSEEYSDYDHFINMKAKLIMDLREIGEKIKLGEEQLVALKATLTTSD